MYSLTIYKKGGNWYAQLNNGKTAVDCIKRDCDNYQDLMVEVANEGWIDVINKNE